MICCEKCDEWYHGDCIGMVEKDSKYIKKWYCDDCIKTYGLEVVYFPISNKVTSKKNKNEKYHMLGCRKDCKATSNNRCGQCSKCLQHEEFENKVYSSIKNQDKYEARETHTVKNENKVESIIDEKLYDSFKKKRHNHGMDWSRQCYGPGCTREARFSSKYCSDDCGLALAKLRILSIIPIRVMERDQNPCVADKLDKSKLENIRLQLKFAYEELLKLDRKEKIESQSAIVSYDKSNTSNCNVFCEYYDSAKKTYCKRLRYVCPDHFKPEKVQENEVCGCPIVKTVSSDLFTGAEKYCQRAKKKCDHHYNWEVLALAEVDLDRLRRWNKLNQLLEDEQRILKQMTNRSGMLGLLLHSTQVCDYSA